MYAMDQDLYNVKGSTTTTVLILSVSPCHHEVKKDAIVVMERAGLVRNNKELAHFARHLSQDAPEKSIYHLAIEVQKPYHLRRFKEIGLTLDNMLFYKQRKYNSEYNTIQYMSPKTC
jgi:hypothetical protein